jgi:transcription-repair coupling factor (superfamily II helicase)
MNMHYSSIYERNPSIDSEDSKGYNKAVTIMKSSNVLQMLMKSEKVKMLEPVIQQERRVALSGLTPSSRLLVFSQVLPALTEPLIYLASTQDRAETIFEDLRLFLPQSRHRQIALYLDKEDEGEKGVFDSSQRLNILQKLSRREPLIVIASLRAVLQKIQTRETLEKGMLELKKGELVDPESLCSLFADMDYERKHVVEGKGEFSRRGCIVDIYPITGDPLRIEFWDEEIESIRIFDIESQRSREERYEASVLPMKASELTTTIIDYLPPASPIIVDEPAQLKLVSLELGEGEHMLTWEGLQDHLSSRKVVEFISWSEEKLHFQCSPVEPMRGAMERFVESVREARERGEQVLIISTQSARIQEILLENGIEPHGAEDFNSLTEGVSIIHGDLSEGFTFESILTVITDREILGRGKKPRYIVTERRQLPIRLEDLALDTPVVHVLHGIGLYKGLHSLTIDGHRKEFITLEYTNADKLYVPIDQMDFIQRFTTMDNKNPSLSKLGGKEWKNTRARVKAIVKEIAEKLIQIYAKRNNLPGFSFSPDSPWQGELESSFPYEETQDQLKAIDEVKKDMESNKPMDRLICGDAGYGKTEVALRSAFKAVMEGTQVAFLVPTTILAEQHYTTFKERLAPFPVRVEMLSRFRTKSEQGAIVEKIKEGAVDIIIGTHRLLQKDVHFKALGLVIVDEEQSFGVEHKERLKELKNEVDTLTMSATPIPRTLHLTLSGIRDMSIITTAPENRIPIKTYIFEYQNDVLRGAIQRELERGGQVYFLHNRVAGINHMAKILEKLVPGARIVTAHGQMSEDNLEVIMKDFMEGSYDILVCTTIIQSGIDIPNVNTIIINNAYAFGLAQLYQLRGRVGRSHRQAYAYLLYPAHRSLNDNAKARMEILKEFSELGAGFHIAMKDLELRGAGNILGTEQHGFVSAVGFDLYCQLLTEAVKEIRGERVTRDQGGPVVELPLSAYLPDEYVPDDPQKLTLYRKMGTISTSAEIKDMEEELKDRFGPLPDAALNLLRLLYLKQYLIELKVPRMACEQDNVYLLMPFIKGGVTLEDLRALAGPQGYNVCFEGNRLTFKGLLEEKNWPDRLQDLLERVQKVPAFQPVLEFTAF